MRSAIKVYITLICSFLLFACGGGGGITDDGSGGGTSPVTISVALSIDNTQISVAKRAEITATVVDSTGSPVSTLVSFELNDDSYGTFTPATGQVSTDPTSGVAKIWLDTASINTGATITAKITSGESASLNVTMIGDGGDAGNGVQVSLVLTNSAGVVNQPITTLSPGKLTATVTGITKPVIVTFAAKIGDLPITSAVTNSEGKASVDIYAGSSLGAGEVTASLSTGEQGEAIVVIGATNVEMGSGSPFTKGVAQASTANLSAGGTATITVKIQDENGVSFTQPIDVNFSSTCATKVPAQAQLSSPVSSSNGTATSTYLAQGCVGEDQINVTANAGGISLSAVTTMNVLQSDIGSIVFISAAPENIGILGTGGIESSVVKFKVLDKNSNVVANQAVDFSLNTNIGGISIDPTTATTNNQGIVQTVVTTGTVSTSVRVTAIVKDSNPIISSQSSQLIISTGIPDQDSFSLSAEIYNAEGWDYEGTEVKVTARMADAFNNPVPNGTTVSFTTEGGAIGDFCQTIAGKCSVTWSSQLPRPEGKIFTNALGIQVLSPKASLKCYNLTDKSENPNCDNENIVYGNFYGQPYGGRATITATAIGEESFADLNGNGRFDPSHEGERKTFLNKKDVTGQSFDLDDAFNDYNEDTVFNPDPKDTVLLGLDGGDLEELIDFNTNNRFDKADKHYNGVLCAKEFDSYDANDPSAVNTATDIEMYCANGNNVSKSLYVRRSIVMVMSGSTAVATLPTEIKIEDEVVIGNNTARRVHFAVENGEEFPIQMIGKGSASVYFTLSDIHNQQLPAGSKILFKTSAGSVTSTTEYTWPSSNHNGGRSFTVSLKGEDEPNNGVFSVIVTTPNEFVTEVISIPVNIL